MQHSWSCDWHTDVKRAIMVNPTWHKQRLACSPLCTTCNPQQHFGGQTTNPSFDRITIKNTAHLNDVTCVHARAHTKLSVPPRQLAHTMHSGNSTAPCFTFLRIWCYLYSLSGCYGCQDWYLGGLRKVHYISTECKTVLYSETNRIIMRTLITVSSCYALDYESPKYNF